MTEPTEPLPVIRGDMPGMPVSVTPDLDALILSEGATVVRTGPTITVTSTLPDGQFGASLKYTDETHAVVFRSLAAWLEREQEPDYD